MSRTNSSNRVTRYLEQHLRTLAPGSPLPSFRQLMEDCRVGPATVSSAVKALEERQLIEVRPKRGIFKANSLPPGATQLTQVDLVYCGLTEFSGAPEAFHGELIRYITELCGERGYRVRMHSLPYEGAVADFEAIATSEDCQACLVVSLRQNELLEPLRQAHVPFVNLFPARGDIPPNSIVTDPNQMVRVQAEHMIELGHRRIGYLHSVEEDRLHRDHVLRREAFYRLVAERGLPLQPNWVAYGGYTDAQGTAAMQAIFEGDGPPTAVICADHRLKVVYQFLNRHHLAIGSDVSVVGTDDLPVASFVDPPATTARVPRLGAARLALDTLDRVVHQGEKIEQPLYVDVRLVKRASTGPPPRED